MTTYDSGSLDRLEALIFVRLPGNDPARFDRFLGAERAIIAAWHVVGDIDLVVHASCRDLPDLDRLITVMRTEGGADGTFTHLIVRETRPSRGTGRLPGAATRPVAEDLAGAGRWGR